MTKLNYLLLLIILTPAITFGQNTLYTKQQVYEDLSYLQSKLIDQHPNINIYTSEEEFSHFFENMDINDSLTELEVYNLIATSNEVIKDGHTLFYPNKEWRENNNSNKLFIPIQPFWDGSNLYVSKNYSSTDKLSKGAKIISINGIKSQELIQGMLSKMMRDGNNYSYPIWVLNTYFYEYFSYFHGCSDEYDIKIDNGTEEVLLVKGISKPKLFEQIDKLQKHSEKGITLEIDQEKSIGILTIKDWHASILRKYYKQRFIPEIKEIIKQIESENTQNLIIDVRNNQGGDTRHSKYLLSYLLDKPFVLVEDYYKKRNKTVVRCNGPQSGTHQPMSKTFKGNIYVLINGGSFSNTGIFGSVLRKHKKATFIGRETGGSEFVICGSPKTIKLPNTGILVELPRLQFMIKSKKVDQYHGIIPDHYIQPNVNSIIEDKDEDLEFTFELINNSSK